jgi:hypothetical protein
MRVFCASGFFKNIKRSIENNAKINELDIRDSLLKRRNS